MFSNFLTHALKSDSLHIQTIYQLSSSHAFTAPGFTNLYKQNFVKIYTTDDRICAEYIQDIQLGKLTFDSSDSSELCLLWLITLLDVYAS